MARGITENDVWTASDALLLEGARPTIERVRQKIGRGSPNTVSPHLDTWFKNLGGRIKDPGAFSAPADVPDPIVQAAKHLWEVAQSESRRDFDQRLQAGMAAAVTNVEAERERAALAEAAAFEAASKAAHLQSELLEFASQLDQERFARAAAQAHLDDAGRQALDLQARVDRSVAELAELRTEAKQEIDSAIERTAAAERRAALEIDAQRAARAKADRRAEVAEKKLEAAHSDALEALAQHMQSTMGSKVEAERLGRELDRVAAAHAEALAEIRTLTDRVISEQLAAERAKGESAAARTAVLHFEALVQGARPRKKAAKSAAAPSSVT
jgi:hypothetical protein